MIASTPHPLFGTFTFSADTLPIDGTTTSTPNPSAIPPGVVSPRNFNAPQLLDPSPASLPPSRKKVCRLCKGRRLGFTAYFHNTAIFAKPPHMIIGLIERSYWLGDRLKSLFISYVMRDQEADQRVEDVEKDIDAWMGRVDKLIDDVQASQGFSKASAALEEVRSWAIGMRDRLINHILGRATIGGRKQALVKSLGQLRELWEKVWQCCTSDEDEGISVNSPNIGEVGYFTQLLNGN